MTLAEAKATAGSVSATFPVVQGEVTAGYWEPRPLSQAPEFRTLFHRGWDIVRREANGTPRSGVTILAEEPGALQFYCAHRSWSYVYDARNFNASGSEWFLNNRFHDAYGNMTILYGKSGLIYVHSHIEDQDFWQLVSRYSESGVVERVPVEWKRWGGSYDRYVMSYGPSRLFVVEQGELVGRIGQMGYSTAPHLHLDVFLSNSPNSRINPSYLWPYRFADPSPLPTAPEEG